MASRSTWPRLLQALLLVVAVWQPATARSADNEVAPPKPMSIREAFSTSASGVSSKGTRHSMQPGAAPLVDVNGEALLAIPIVADASTAYTLTIHSSVMRLGRDEYVLYYPLVSLINADHQVQQTLKPRYEFSFEGNILSNEFSIPAGASWLLVHTSAEFFRSDFVGSTSRGGSRGGGAAALLGGAIGGAIVMTLAQGKERPFRFGEIGLIAIARE
jgi:hypothetical protein